MEAMIGGVLVGAAAALLGRPIVSGLFKVLQPVGEGIVTAANTAVETVGGLVSVATATVTGSTASPTGQNQDSSAEGEGVVKKVEEFGKDIAVDLVEEEAISFIKMVLIAAL